MHIHLHAVLIFIALYQQWAPLLMPNPATIDVALHAGLATVEVVGIIILWHFAEEAERDSQVMREAAQQVVDGRERLTANAR